MDTKALPNIDADSFHPIDPKTNCPPENSSAVKILLLYGSLRERSFSRLATEEAARLLNAFGAETRSFNPSGLPLPDDAEDTHPKVQELRDLVTWCEGMVWCSPERHGGSKRFLRTKGSGRRRSSA